MEVDRFLELLYDQDILTPEEENEGWRFCAIEGTSLLLNKKQLKLIAEDHIKSFIVQLLN